MEIPKKIWFIALIALTLQGCAVSNKSLLIAINKVSQKLDRIDSTYNAQRLIFYKNGFQKIDQHIDAMPDSVLLNEVKKLTKPGRKN